jgi:hypothetical protein
MITPCADAAKAGADRVTDVVDMMTKGQVYVFAFTRSAQMRRMFEVVRDVRSETPIRDGLARAQSDHESSLPILLCSVTVATAPQGSYSMKPLVNSIVKDVSR